MTINRGELIWFITVCILKWLFPYILSVVNILKETVYICRVIDTLKDYATKAIVNTVDHLGSVTYKVNDFLDENIDEVSGTELHVSCIEQVSLD